MSDERIDIVNEKDEVVGVASRREVHEKELLHHDCLCLFVQEDGAILQRRSKAKDLFPGVLTFTVSGHLAAGETYEDGLAREGQEETGIAISSTKLTLVAKVHELEPNAYGNKAHNILHGIFVYEFEGNVEDLQADPDEADGFIVLPLADVLSGRKSRQEFSPPIVNEKILKALRGYFVGKGML